MTHRVIFLPRFYRSMMSTNKLILLLFIHFIVGILVGHFISNKKIIYESNYILPTGASSSNKASQRLINLPSSHIEIVNFSKAINVDFKCMKTKTLLNHFHSHICVYESQKDVYVSNSFRESASIWEEEGVVRILQMLLRYPHLDFIDIGANIGTYTMYAAALGRFVLAIECFGPNVERIHRAVQLSNIANRVLLVQNALYTESGKYVKLSNVSTNVGGQELDVAMRPNNSEPFANNQNRTNDPYLVKTIRFDDLVPLLLERSMRGAIMKVDIEGSESFIVEAGSQIFDLFEIPMVQIEWLKVRDFPNRVKTLIDFFVKRNYEPKTFQCNLLDFKQVQQWPNDFCWIKRNFTFC
ncbi:hypothetical protein I4U23_002743 [Adineta vaga]|nr:hypothetical protein I4U23_002743 [Adineta vaga]